MHGQNHIKFNDTFNIRPYILRASVHLWHLNIALHTRTCAKRTKELKISFELTSSSAPGIEKLRNGGVRPCTNWKIFLPFLIHSTRCSCSIFTSYSHCSKAESPTTTYRGSLSSTLKRDMASETKDGHRICSRNKRAYSHRSTLRPVALSKLQL